MMDMRWEMVPHKQNVLMLAKRQLAKLVYDSVNLEGVAYTLSEICWYNCWWA